MFDHNLGDLQTLLKRHGLDSRILDDPYAPVPMRSYLSFFEDAAQMLDDPVLGLRLGAQVRPGQLGPVGLRAAQCATIRRGLDSIVRFNTALQNGTRVSLDEDGPHVHMTYKITTPTAGPARQDAEFSISGTCSLIRKAFDPRFRAVEIQFAHAAPDHAAQYERWFRAPVRFGCPVNAIIMDTTEADRIYREEDPDMMELIDRHLAGLVEEAYRTHSVADQARALIELNLGHKPVDLALIADQMQCAPRSLQRRLAEEGLTLSDLLRACRQERAAILLSDGKTAIEEIALSLGYSDGTAFWRAYRIWTGESPSVTRHRLDQDLSGRHKTDALRG